VGAETLSQDQDLRSANGDGHEPGEPGKPGKMSRFLWGIDWSEWLPRGVSDDGIELHLSDIESALPFISAHYGEIFEQDLERGRFFNEPFDGAKSRYYRMADVFEIKHAERTIGVFIGTPSDWSTYYLRSMGLLPAYQGQKLPRVILPFLFERLAGAGVRRFEADTSPSNLATVRWLTHLGFNVTGTVLSERWGALLRLTKFVDEVAEDVFLDKFCSGIRYQKRHRGSQHMTQ